MTNGFEARVAGEEQRKGLRLGEASCGILFYLAMLAQVVLFIVVFASQNTKIREDGGDCPDGYSWGYGIYCLHDSIKEQSDACSQGLSGGGRRLEQLKVSGVNVSFEEHLRLFANDDSAASPKDRMMRRLATRRLAGEKIPVDVWQFLEEFVQMPIIIFGGVFIVASFWLLAMTKATGPTVWITLAADILAMIAGVIWCLIELEEVNWMLLVGAVGCTIGVIVARKQIQTAIVVMHKAMDGLAHNKRLVPVSFAITCLWIGFFAMWIASLIGLDLIKEVRPIEHEVCSYDYEEGSTRETCKMEKQCSVENQYPHDIRWLWIICYYWSTFFFNNAKLIVITCQLGDWFFNENQHDNTIWSKAIVWAFHPFKSGGANAISSGIMGLTQYLLNYFNGKVRLCLAMFNPIEWIPICLAFALKQLIFTYTKYGLIAQAFSGQPFCSAAHQTFTLLKAKLGEAFIVDYIGRRVLNWCTYLLSLGVAMAALTWSNSLQGRNDANVIFEKISLLIFVMLGLAWIVSYPFFSVVFIVLLENLLPNDIDPSARAILNSVFAAIFMGSITRFLLETMSHVVVSAMDVIYFCFAVETELGQKQDRFTDLYEAIKETIAPGVVNNQGVVVGQPIPVVVPEGAAPGSLLQIPGPTGPMQVQVPEGVAPGQIFTVVPPQVQQAPAATAQVVGSPMQPAAKENIVPTTSNVVATNNSNTTQVEVA